MSFWILKTRSSCARSYWQFETSCHVDMWQWQAWSDYMLHWELGWRFQTTFSSSIHPNPKHLQWRISFQVVVAQVISMALLSNEFGWSSFNHGSNTATMIDDPTVTGKVCFTYKQLQTIVSLSHWYLERQASTLLVAALSTTVQQDSSLLERILKFLPPRSFLKIGIISATWP